MDIDLDTTKYYVLGNEDISTDLEHLLGIDAARHKKAGALYLLKLKENHCLSQTAIDDVMEGSKTVFSYTVQRLHSSVRSKLASLGIDEAQFDSVFEDLSDPFVGLETKYKQEKYFVEDLGLVVSSCVFKSKRYSVSQQL